MAMEDSPAPPVSPPARWEEFLARAAECRQAVERMKSPLIVNHYDCDGLTSGAIVCAFLEERKIPYRINTIRKLDEAVLNEIRREPELVFTDLGGGSDGVQELGGEVVIFDHHPPAPKNARLQLNPHMFGIDGGTQMCGATTAYWSLRTLPEAAIVGAVGDVQSPMQGPNRLLLQELQKAGAVQAPIDLKMYGRISRPLPQLLAYADDPYLPGLSGHDERCAQFLESLGKGFGKKSGGEGWKTYSELAPEERKKLIGALAVHIAEVSGGKFPASRLVGEVYLFPRFASTPELYEAGEFSTLMNACGRHEQPQLGIDICLGRAGALEKGTALLALHRRLLREGVEFAYASARDWGPFLFLDGRGVIDDGIIGVVAGMLYPGGRQKPILAIALDQSGQIKISTRGTKKLVGMGLNLGMALREACTPLGGAGGGHAIAAGAGLPPDKLDEFLKTFPQILQKQMKEEKK
ncbi:MAG: DHH family phosphoesterase [Candidatus Marsarchaeota archaeon]|nr:DHH family phosphoesterase [Candidatus Marsarchaeota archaeon]